MLSNASYSWGGVHLVTENLARGLTARGHEVVVFCRPDSILLRRLTGVVPCEPLLKGMDLHPIVLARCARALRRHRPDVVLTLMDKDVRMTSPVARALGIPVVVRRANDRPLSRGPYGRLFYGVLPTLHVANSHATRATMLASAPWLDPRKVVVIHNGIDVDLFRDASPANLGVPPGAVAVGFAGRFDRRKGILDLAEAWPRVAAEVPNAHLVIVGKGGREADARAILDHHPRVHWTGFRSDIAPVIRAFDILAMPSHWEGFGLTAVEAMAAGVPVVATNVSSLPELVRHEVDGLLVPPANPGALAEAIVTLARDPALRTRMGNAGQQRAREAFAMDRMVDRYEEVLASAITGRR